MATFGDSYTDRMALPVTEPRPVSGDSRSTCKAEWTCRNRKAEERQDLAKDRWRDPWERYLMRACRRAAGKFLQLARFR